MIGIDARQRYRNICKEDLAHQLKGFPRKRCKLEPPSNVFIFEYYPGASHLPIRQNLSALQSDNKSWSTERTLLVSDHRNGRPALSKGREKPTPWNCKCQEKGEFPLCA